MSKIYQQLKNNDRLETGLIQDGNDYCGAFIRGVDCFEYSNALKVILSETTCENTLIVGQLKELMDLFRSVDQESVEFDSSRIQLIKKL